ncbi:hypothetical protein [Pseudoclavibacter sp. VKM Ac-2888]|uniref:hypothetical protein n=1 Tax=Pseudoclavibacter sp. VKM Ac-2888 TaxID=2783830 RepID=UPI00188CCA29|nr:hypothetical protein [Pseudoclavibacter sp. VKM Ac-2888]MBF4549677.1 hypothetical protein [Pseudoclavibacter sp. VKM Ac-2888]
METGNENQNDSTGNDDADIEEQDASQEQADGTENDDAKGDKQEGAEAADLSKVQEKIRKLNSEAATLRKRAKEAEAKAKDSEGSSEKVTALEAENLRLQVALDTGLPANLAKRLVGDTKEALLEDAEQLLELTQGRRPPTNQPNVKLKGGGGNDLPDDAVVGDLDKFAADVFK